ncbi:3-dehydroquinate synthase [Sorangium cellulosum]|uniref:3-dehydroquinate synthase n=1 Tax=Sorangium cellulosum TaxID=56 RepID=A0A2L0EKH2_SORCE|nr:3-dehydroquinate synthase [Sorangium cellulosum]
MLLHVQRFVVPFEYPVYFTDGVFSPSNGDLAAAVASKEPHRRHRVLPVIDGGVAAAWPTIAEDIARYAGAHAERLSLAADAIVVPGGEAAKNDGAATAALQARLDALGMDRHAFVMIVGGGAVLDMAAYAAATVHRGVRVVRIPTTVLAQADSGVGVKNGVNAFGKKNLLGTFAPPFAVLIDPRFLETLPLRDRVAGMAEAVKVALIRDVRLFSWLSEQAPALAAGALGPLAELVRRSAEIHLRHIASGGDPFELGSARPLDFGHWAAHKLESLTRHRLRHGEAVAIGIALDAVYGELAGVSRAGTAAAVLALLEALGFALWDDALAIAAEGGERLAVLDGLAEFREHLGGELTVTLLEEVGRAREVHVMDERHVTAAIERLRERAGRRAQGGRRAAVAGEADDGGGAARAGGAASGVRS